MATILYRHNVISSLTREDGSVAIDHHEKAGILKQTFIDRLGSTIPIDQSFDFSAHLAQHNGLEFLSARFRVQPPQTLKATRVIRKLMVRNPRAKGIRGLVCRVTTQSTKMLYATTVESQGTMWDYVLFLSVASYVESLGTTWTHVLSGINLSPLQNILEAQTMVLVSFILRWRV